MVTTLGVAGTISAVGTLASAGASVYSAVAGGKGGSSGGGGAFPYGPDELSGEFMDLANEHIEGALGRIDDRVAQRARKERQRSRLEGLLGTEAQIRGFNYTPEEEQYFTRFAAPGSARREYVQGLNLDKQGRKEANKAYKTDLNRANTLMDQAEEAALNGDFGAASSLRDQAMALMDPYGDSATSFNRRDIPKGTKGAGKFKRLAKKNKKDEEIMSSPMAITAGRIVKRGEDLMDPTSAEYERFFRALTEAPIAEMEKGRLMAERSIAAERRGIEGQIQQAGAGRGFGRNLMAERALQARVGDQVAMERANMHLEVSTRIGSILGQASAYLEEYAPKFGAFAIQVGRDFISGLPFQRDAYQNALDSLAIAGAEIEGAFARTALAGAAGLADTGAQLSAGYGREMRDREAAQDALRQGQMAGLAEQVGKINWGKVGKGVSDIYDNWTGGIGGTGVSNSQFDDIFGNGGSYSRGNYSIPSLNP